MFEHDGLFSPATLEGWRYQASILDVPGLCGILPADYIMAYFLTDHV